MEKSTGCVLYGFYGNLLTKRQQDIFESYYLYDNSLGEIGERLGITRQSVRDALVKAGKILTETEEKLGFSALTYEIIGGLAALKEGAPESLKERIDGMIHRLEE